MKVMQCFSLTSVLLTAILTIAKELYLNFHKCKIFTHGFQFAKTAKVSSGKSLSPYSNNFNPFDIQSHIRSIRKVFTIMVSYSTANVRLQACLTYYSYSMRSHYVCRLYSCTAHVVVVVGWVSEQRWPLSFGHGIVMRKYLLVGHIPPSFHH